MPHDRADVIAIVSGDLVAHRRGRILHGAELDGVIEALAQGGELPPGVRLAPMTPTGPAIGLTRPDVVY